MSIQPDTHQRTPIMPPPEVRDLFAEAQELYDAIFVDDRGYDNINRFIEMSDDKVRQLAQEFVDFAEQDSASINWDGENWDWDEKTWAIEKERHDRHLYYHTNILILYRQALKAASKDGLTGLYNKKAMLDAIETKIKKLHDEVIVEENRRAGFQQDKGSALIAIDLDRFKPFNDVFDHATGDAAIIKAADFIDSQIRPDDVAARMGGDEFSVLVSNVDDKSARIMLEHLKEGFSNLAIEVDLDRPINLSANDLKKIGRDAKSTWSANDLSVEEYDKLGMRVERSGKLLKVFVGASFGMAMLDKTMDVKDLDKAADADMIAYKNAHRHATYSR